MSQSETQRLIEEARRVREARYSQAFAPEIEVTLGPLRDPPAADAWAAACRALSDAESALAEARDACARLCDHLVEQGATLGGRAPRDRACAIVAHASTIVRAAGEQAGSSARVLAALRDEARAPTETDQ